MTTYNFSIQSDTPNNKVSIDRLTIEIQQSGIVTALDAISTSGDVLAIDFKAALSGGDETLLTALLAAHSGEPLPQNIPAPVQLFAAQNIPAPLTGDHRIRFSAEKSTATRATIYTHDWADPTTWYTNAVYVSAETATLDTGDNTNKTWLLAHSKVIDTFHGNITQEDFLLDGSGRSFRVTVTVNGTPKTERDPHLGSGGDYTVDYLNGKILFLAGLQTNDAVLVTYHYADTSAGDGSASLFRVVPATGTKLEIVAAETLFSADAVMNDSVIFAVYGFVDVFAPQLMPGVPSGTKIEIARVVYKTFSDFQNDALKSYTPYPAFGGNNWRSQPQATYVFNWDYVSSFVLHAAYGMEIRMFLQHDVPFSGWLSTATFYCTSEAT